MLQKFLITIDRFSMAVGHAFAWCILILTLGTSYGVFMRYVLNDPTSWAFDMSYILYGALFLMSGAYALSRDAHVRGDVIFRLLPLLSDASNEIVSSKRSMTVCRRRAPIFSVLSFTCQAVSAIRRTPSWLNVNPRPSVANNA